MQESFVARQVDSIRSQVRPKALYVAQTTNMSERGGHEESLVMEQC